MKIRSILKMITLVTMLSGINTSAVAALITGDIGVTGSYSTSGGSDLSNDTDIILGAVVGTNGSGDLASISFGTFGSINNGSFSLTAFSPVIDVFTIAGWQLDLTTLSITDQTTELLTMEGAGVLSGQGFEATIASWTYSSQGSSSYSLSVTSLEAVPVPAAVWLFASGLVSLIGVARRKAST